MACHHGSRTSSTARFLDAVAPQVAVFQAAYRSRFGHPAPDVLQRYRDRGIAIVDSPGCGAWHRPAGPANTGVCQRDVARRYWHHRAAPSAVSVVEAASMPSIAVRRSMRDSKRR